MRRCLSIVTVTLFCAPVAAQQPQDKQNLAPFVIHQIATGVAGGYQVIAADINHDGKVDVIGLSQSGDLVWYENPDWTPHIILSQSQAQGMTGQSEWHMVNADAAELDGDGTPEIALAYGFNANAPLSIGNIGILHSGDAGKSWTLREIGRVPAAHRVRFANISGNGRKDLLVAPVLNETDSGGLANPAHLPVPLYLFEQDKKGSWRRETITQENMGLVHAVQPYDWDGDGRDEVLTAGFSGVFLHKKTGSNWVRSMLAVGDPSPWPNSGAGEVAIGYIGGKRFFVTIEHFHGNMLVVYLPRGNGYQRHVIDTGLVTGHALLVADLDGDGVPEIIAAGDGSRANLFFYKATDTSGLTWTKMLMDDDMAASSCAIADINADGRPDVVCMDNRKPNFIKWYEYRSR
jgi:hypothetical protein